MKRNTNSTNPDLVEKMIDIVGKLEERLMKKVEEKLPIATSEVNMAPPVLTAPGVFSIPAHVTDQIQEVMKVREDQAYSKGMQTGMIIGGVAVGLIVFRSLFR